MRPPFSRCALCGFIFDDTRLTGSDVTPYAKAYARGLPGWRRMGEWVWFCGRGRLKHLALMRASAASRKFAHRNLLLLALGLALFEATRAGWRWVTMVAASVPPRPEGAFWVRVAAPSPLGLSGLPSPDRAELWWNPVQTAAAAVVALMLGFFVAWLMMVVVRAAVTRAHQEPYRRDQRMTAALHYSTAWCVPLFAAGVIAGLRPVAYIGRVRQWPWCPSDQGLLLSAATVAAFGAIMWWFWLLRLGATAPARTRGAVVGFLAVGTPLIVAAVAAGWWYFLEEVYAPMLVLMNVGN